jgi:hypothetical protein
MFREGGSQLSIELQASLGISQPNRRTVVESMTVNLIKMENVGDCEGEINVYIACHLHANDTFVTHYEACCLQEWCPWIFLIEFSLF